jgi:hypothetical protein
MLRRHNSHRSTKLRQLGQAFTEYLPIISLIALIGVTAVTQFGSATGHQGGRIALSIAGKRIDGGGSTNNSTAVTTTQTGNGQNNAANTPASNAQANGNNPSLASQAADFVKGVWNGLKQQGLDAISMVAHPIDTAKNLYALAEAMVTDPGGTLKTIAQELGQDVTNLISGTAQQRGETIGKYLNPVALVKIVGVLSRVSKLHIPKTKIKTGCSSFAAGTLVWTPNGLVPIQLLDVGGVVSSRNEESYQDAAQLVIATRGRTVPYYYHLSTGSDEIDVTEEHPFWLQGKGWTEVKDLVPGDAIATIEGDILVTAISKIKQPLRVYNFTVANTPSYFVSNTGIWVHNANVVCNIGGDVVKAGLTSDKAFELIDKFRNLKQGMDPLGDYIPVKKDKMGTVAVIDLDGRPVFGVNSDALIRNADKDLMRKWRDLMGWNSGQAQAAFHAEGMSLMRAYEKTGGKLPSTVNMFVDRKTCSICRTYLPELSQKMGTNINLTFKDGTTAKIIDGIYIPGV